jgi:host factor-I protein
MADKALSLQDQFLNSIRRSKVPVTIFLVKGVKLQGIVTWYDPFSLLLRRDGSAQLVYKHAISTIMPAQPPEDLEMSNGGEGGNGKKPMLQDLFLQAASREQEPMTVFLVNGVMLQGAVAGFDQFSLVLERGGQVQLVYKHAISTMQPGHPLNLGGETSPGEND